jgi:hypothetical protein
MGSGGIGKEGGRNQPNLGEEGEGPEEGGPEVGPPRLWRARPDGGAVGDDPEGEIDGDAAAVEVPRVLVPRVGLQEVPEASPHPHLSLPPAPGSAIVASATCGTRGG